LLLITVTEKYIGIHQIDLQNFTSFYVFNEEISVDCFDLNEEFYLLYSSLSKLYFKSIKEESKGEEIDFSSKIIDIKANGASF